MLEYLDFDLEIGEGDGRDYTLAVLRSPAGEGAASERQGGRGLATDYGNGLNGFLPNTDLLTGMYNI
jgi:hypothetical protein